MKLGRKMDGQTMMLLGYPRLKKVVFKINLIVNLKLVRTMGYIYGIEICRNALIKLSSEKMFDDRLREADSEMGVITDTDVSKKHKKLIQSLREKFQAIPNLAIGIDGGLISNDKKAELIKLKMSSFIYVLKLLSIIQGI